MTQGCHLIGGIYKRTATGCRSSCKWFLQVRWFATVYFTFFAFQCCQTLSTKQPWQWSEIPHDGFCNVGRSGTSRGRTTSTVWVLLVPMVRHPSPGSCRTCSSCLSIPGASLLVIIENLDISLHTAPQLKSQLHSKRKLANLNVIVAPFFMQSCKTDMASAMPMSVDKINGHGHLCLHWGRCCCLHEVWQLSKRLVWIS